MTGLKDYDLDGGREWIKTTDRLPTISGGTDVHVDCFIFVSGHIEIRPFNTCHICWDRQDYDDYCYDALKPSHWMLLEWPEEPKEADSGN